MLNKIGERIPPCLTPLPTKKSGEIELPHRTHIVWYVCVFGGGGGVCVCL